MVTRPDTCLDLRCEYASNPLGIDAKQPSLGWRMDSSRRNAKQSAYHILVSISEEGVPSEADVTWNSGIVETDQSTHIRYSGIELVSSQRYYWRVRIRNDRGEWTSWSETAWWETGLFRAEDWKAEWIEPSDGHQRNALYMRNRFELDEAVLSARAYVTSHGVYKLSINGQIVGNDVLQPGYTSYNDRLQYQTYDVTGLFGSGTNVVGIVVGDGWYRGKLTITSLQNVYGPTLGALIQIYIVFRNGLHATICSGNGWLWSTGPILRSDSKDGELYDARLEMLGWDTNSFDDSLWKEVHVADHGVANLVASSSPPVRRQEQIAPVEIIRTPNGKTVVDFGQNIAGRVRIRVPGKKSATIRLRHGESLDSRGNFSLSHLLPTAPGVAPLLQEDVYIARGDGQREEHEPMFSVHGFRYVEITGWPGEPSKDDLVAVAIYSDMEQTGTFECSDSRINRLHENIVWSMKSNSVDIPTDCPTRERAGWTGDVQIFANSGAYLMNTAAFLEKWLRDLVVDQRPNGIVPNTVPDACRYKSSLLSEITEGSAGWGDASVIVPWTLYRFFGDISVLENQYESMKKWTEYGISRSEHGSLTSRINPILRMDADRLHRQPFILNSGYHWEEWLAPGESKKTPWNMTRNILTNRKSESIVATAYLAYSTELLVKIAQILDRDDDAKRYSAINANIRSAFVEEFVDDGLLDPDTQSAYVRALAFDLLPESIRPRAIARLVKLIQDKGCHLDTGFLSTPLICPVLSTYGHIDLAYELLLQDSYPSWLYSVDKGATTIWESWDAIDESGHVNGSLNHTAFGSIAYWLYQTVAGISSDTHAPGFQDFILRPNPTNRLTYAEATYRSLYGTIFSRWEIRAGRLIYRVNIPPNATATVILPKTKEDEIVEGGKSIMRHDDIRVVNSGPDSVSLRVGSGHYVFDVERS